MPWKKELQATIRPFPNLRRKWFLSDRIICRDEGWAFFLTQSGGSRVDGYHYEEHGRKLTLGGEGGAGVMDIVLPSQLCWDDDSKPLDEAERKRILHNITAAIQWIGFSAEFVYEGIEDNASV
jgi:hypothetical protein